MKPKLALLEALTSAISRMSAVVAAIAGDDFDTAEAELSEVSRIISEQAQELRAA